MRVISIMNRKGGVAKTTTACNLAWQLAANFGKKVLLLDLDGQGNAATMMTGENCAMCHGAVYMMQHPEAKMEDYASPVREDYYDEMMGRDGGEDGCSLDVLPGGAGLFRFDDEATSTKMLRTMLGRFSWMYDFAVIDCPPSFNMAVANALYATDLLIVPTTAASSSLVGAETVLRETNSWEKSVQRRLIGVMVHPNLKKEAKEDLEAIAEFWEVKTFGQVPYSVKAVEADAACELLSLYSPQCMATRAYRALADEICELWED